MPRIAYIGLSAGILLIAGVATAQESDASLYMDAQSYAATYGTSFEDALQRLSLQKAIGNLETRMSEDSNGGYAGMWIEHSPVFRVVVRSKGSRDTPFTMASLVDPRLVGLVDVMPASASMADLRASRRAGIRLARQISILADASIDVRKNRAQLRILNRAAFEAKMAAQGLSLPKNLELVEVDELVKPEATIFGGLPISTCTLGFSVQNSSGTRGVTTAAHCGNSQNWSGGRLSFAGERYRDNFDVQWHTSPGDNVTNQFDAGNGIRTCTGTRGRNSQFVGEFVCKNGRTTGNTCGTIQSRSFAPSYVPSVNATFVYVDGGSTNLSEGGDSGGPWFSGNTAYGIHSGGRGNDSVYMPINYVSGIGVGVLTN